MKGKKSLSPVRLYSIRMRAERGRAHISGAEGIFEGADIARTVQAYVKRALNHSKGVPDTLKLSIEPLQGPPEIISALPVYTLKTGGPADARKKAARLLLASGVSARAITRAFGVISAGNMRGAALLDSKSGRRLEPEGEKRRGVRATMLGISQSAERKLRTGLLKKRIAHPRVKDALILASKVAAAPGVVAELCVSDDPDYTTGYVSSPGLGYIRLPRIKKREGFEGGRAFFMTGSAAIRPFVNYLEKTPVMVGKISGIGDIITLHEFEASLDNRKPGGKKILRKKS